MVQRERRNARGAPRRDRSRPRAGRGLPRPRSPSGTRPRADRVGGERAGESRPLRRRGASSGSRAASGDPAAGPAGCVRRGRSSGVAACLRGIRRVPGPHGVARRRLIARCAGGTGWYQRSVGRIGSVAHRSRVEPLPVAEVLPGLYRAVLDSVARLETLGRRREAAEIRADATAAYSKAWNAAAERRLRTLRARAERIEEARRRAAPAAVENRPRAID